MPISFSTYDIRAQLPSCIGQPLSDGLTQTTNPEVPGGLNSFQSNSADLDGNSLSESNDDSDLPPRPESRLDFAPRSTCALDRPSDNQIKAQYCSHKRTPSATFRWTREILKKIRLSTSGSSSTLATSDSVECSNASAVKSPPISTHEVPQQSTSDFLAEEENSTDVASMSTSFGELYSSISNSSLLSTSSSNALDNISVSLSSSSDFGSCEDIDDSDSELDSLKEVDLGDGLTGDDDEVEHDEYDNVIRGKQFYSIASQAPVFETSVATITAVSSPTLSTPSLSPSLSLSSSLAVESVSESLHAINGEDPDEASLQYVVEPRQKYTCLPSPLSHINPNPELAYSGTSLPPLQPQRHIYTHRGHSRTALHYRKWFWALREEDWERYAEWVEECRSQQEAYTAMSLSPEITNPQSSDENAAIGVGDGSPINIGGWGWKAEDHDLCQLFPSLFSKARETMPNNLQQWSQVSGRDGLSEVVSMSSNLPPLSIHPRWGDLVNNNLSMSYSSVSACLDTWCMHTDRYLLVGMGLGLWTIRKVLWISELNRMCAAVDQTRFSEGEQTFVAEEGLDSDASIRSRSDDTASLSDDFEDDDEEEGQVMCSSVVSLTSFVSATESFNASDSDDSDVTLVESDTDSEARIASTSSSSLSAIAARADAQRNGRSVDFEKTCSSTYGSLDDGDEEDFEEINLGLGSGSSNSERSFEPCSATGSKGLESPTLLRRLYISQHSELSASSYPSILSTSTQAKGCSQSPTTSFKRKSGAYRLSRQEEQPLEKRSWYQQCELLLSLSGARETMA